MVRTSQLVSATQGDWKEILPLYFWGSSICSLELVADPRLDSGKTPPSRVLSSNACELFLRTQGASRASLCFAKRRDQPMDATGIPRSQSPGLFTPPGEADRKPGTSGTSAQRACYG